MQIDYICQNWKKELVTLKQSIRIYSQDIEMKFGIEKFIMFIMKSRKREITEGRERQNHKTWRKRKLQIPGNTKSEHNQTNRNKRKKVEVLKKNNKTSRYPTLQ